MTRTLAATVRASVVSRTRRVDLVLPAEIPLVELLPGLARGAGILDRATASGGYLVLTGGGRMLRLDLSLSEQGVDDGALLVVSSDADESVIARHDDLAEVVASLVDRGARRNLTRAAEPVGLASATALLLVALLAVVALRDPLLVRAFALAVATVAVLAAATFSRVRGDVVAGVTLGILGCLVASVGIGMSTGDTLATGATVTRVGGALAGAAFLTALMIGQGRLLLLPLGSIGAIVASSGLLLDAGVDPARCLTGLLVVVVVGGGQFPGLALSTTGVGRHARRLESPANSSAQLDLPTIRRDVELAREILVAVSVTTGLLLVLIAPLAVNLGPAGAAIPVLACLVVMLRSRRYVVPVDVLIARISGVVGIVVSTVSMLYLHDWSRLPIAALTATASLGVLIVLLLPDSGALARRHLGDILESVSLGALVPALVLAVGLSVAWP